METSENVNDKKSDSEKTKEMVSINQENVTKTKEKKDMENIETKQNENKNDNENDKENPKKKQNDEKEGTENEQKNEGHSKNEENEKNKNNSENNITAGGNDIGKFLDFIQNNKNNPELMQKLLNIVNLEADDSTVKNKDNIENEKREAFETNGININKDQNETKIEMVKREMAYRENNKMEMFQQHQINASRIDSARDKQESRFFKIFEKNASFTNLESNQKISSANLANSSGKADTLNKKIASTIPSIYGQGKIFDEVKDMLKNMKINENKDMHGNQKEGSEAIKKKHVVLVEDNDEYDIDTSALNGCDTEAASIFNKLNMNHNNSNLGSTCVTNNLDSTDIVKNMCASSNYKIGDNKDGGDFKLYHSNYTWIDLNVDKELINVLVLYKFYNPSKIQAFALPIILNTNRNLIAQSQNGSGKTLTFVIGMLSKIDRNASHLQAMCICPTRELSQQNFEVIKNFTIYLKLKVFLGVPLCDKYNKNDGYQLYVGTPGKTLDFLKRRYLDTRHVKLFVLDEADDLVDIKNNMATQVDYIKKLLPKTCQVLLFSATYNKTVFAFADRFAPQAIKIKVRQEELTLKCVKQYYLITENENHKYYYLSELYCSMTISQCVIFVNSKQSAFNLYKFMTDNHHNVTLICADSVISRFTKNKIQKTDVIGMDPKTRDTLMSDFKKGISKVLICTDLLSRGIDIPSISLVINFDLPYIYQGRIDERTNTIQNQKVNMETYIHRIGRTGRFGSKGMAINFINKQQLPHIKQIEQYYQCTISDLEYDSELMKTSITKLSI